MWPCEEAGYLRSPGGVVEKKGEVRCDRSALRGVGHVAQEKRGSIYACCIPISSCMFCSTCVLIVQLCIQSQSIIKRIGKEDGGFQIQYIPLS